MNKISYLSPLFFLNLLFFNCYEDNDNSKTKNISFKKKQSKVSNISSEDKQIKINEFLQNSKCYLEAEWGYDKGQFPIINIFVRRDHYRQLKNIKHLINNELYTKKKQDLEYASELADSISNYKSLKDLYYTTKIIEAFVKKNEGDIPSLGLARLYAILGNLYFRAHEFKRGYPFYEDALKIYIKQRQINSSIQIKKEIIYTRFHLASIYTASHKYIKWKEQRLLLKKEIEDHNIDISDAIINCNDNNLKEKECVIL